LGSAQNLAIDNLGFAAGIVAAPGVTTQPATALTPLGATLNASVTPNTLATTCYFQYGTNLSYGSFTATNSLAAGLIPVAVSSPISGLRPSTTYHFQAVAANSLGVTVGADLPFTTAPVAAPRLSAVTYSSGGAHFTFTNTPGVTFTVLGTTNMALPVNQWDNLGHPTEGPAGQYQFTDPQTNQPEHFYRVRQP
jgi:hypothetical protein